MTQDTSSDTVELPRKPRELHVPQEKDWEPSRGFRTPHARERFRMVAALTDERTAISLYALVHEHGYGNVEQALKRAIGQIGPSGPNGYRWRYYCPECDFISAVHKSFTEAEHGSKTHTNVAKHECDPEVFAFRTGEWDPDNVTELIEQYKEETRNEIEH